MKTLARNKRPFIYCLCLEQVAPLYDEYGNETGEYTVKYGAPVTEWGNISPASGHSVEEIFGSLDNYDKVIVLDGTDTPIDTETVLFIGKPYEETSEKQPIYNYTVRRVAKSLNFTAIAVREVVVNSCQVLSG